MTNERIGKTNLRSRILPSKSFDDCDISIAVAASLPCSGVNRIHSHTNYCNKTNGSIPKSRSVILTSQLASSSDGASILETSTPTMDEIPINVATGTTTGSRAPRIPIRSCLVIIAMIVTLCQFQLLLFRSVTNANVTRLFDSPTSYISAGTGAVIGNVHVPDFNVKSLFLSNFIRPKQASKTTFTPLLNVQCESSPQHVDSDGINGDGMTLTETRQLTKIPTFIIAGAQKAGTSALYHMLPKMQRYTSKHIRRSTKFETHFFTRHIHAVDEHALKKEDICILRQLYQKEFARPVDENSTTRMYMPINDDTITFEKSPIYLCNPQLPSFIYQVVPWTKLLFILRNPIDRVFSQWKMEQARRFHHHPNKTMMVLKDIKLKKPLKSFIDMVDDEVQKLRKHQLSRAPNLSAYVKFTTEQRNKIKVFRVPKSVVERVHGLQEPSPSRGASNSDSTVQIQREIMSYPLSRGMYAQQLYFWIHPKYGGIGEYRINQNIKMLQYEQLVNDRTKVLQETVEFLGMPLLLKYPNGTNVKPDNELFDVDLSPGPYTLEERKSMWYSKTTTSNSTTGTGTNPIARQFTTLDNMKDISNVDELSNIKMDAIVREYLHKFYQPYNDELVLQLGKAWKDIWNK